jgi:hypothetical protein
VTREFALALRALAVSLPPRTAIPIPREALLELLGEREKWRISRFPAPRAHTARGGGTAEGFSELPAGELVPQASAARQWPAGSASRALPS